MTTKPEDALVERLRARLRECIGTPEGIEERWRESYPETRREEIKSFLYSVTPHYTKGNPVFPLHYIAQMLSTQSRLAPPQGSFHHACALASETLDFYADAITTLLERERRKDEALRTMIYETTHLSPELPDGSHNCIISKQALSQARAALTGVDK